MKRILLCLLCLCLLNTQISCSENKADQDEVSSSHFSEARYFHEDQEIDGMTYRVWFKGRQPHCYDIGYAVFAVNLTKDKLEVELLRKQLGH